MGRWTMAKNQEIFTQKLPAPKIVQWKGSKKTMYGRMGGGWAAVGSSWPLTPSLNGSYMPVTATHPYTTIPYRTIYCTELSHCKVTFWTLSYPQYATTSFLLPLAKGLPWYNHVRLLCYDILQATVLPVSPKQPLPIHLQPSSYSCYICTLGRAGRQFFWSTWW